MVETSASAGYFQINLNTLYGTEPQSGIVNHGYALGDVQ